jgi:tetratricopeptide (TPR) repeat protein
MRHIKHIQINILLFTIVFSLISISGKSDGNEENAIKLFKSKQYEEALPLFSELIKSYPTDTIFYYYTGVCLVETNHFGDQAKNTLMVASQGTVPGDVNYFIGKNFQATNFFDSALTYYNLFKESAKSKEIKTVELKEKISMCSSRINPFKNANTTLPKSEIRDGLAGLVQNVDENDPKTDNLGSSNSRDSIQKEEFAIEIPSVLNDTIINFNLTSDIYYTKFFQFRTKEGKQYFIEGWKNSEELNKFIFETDSLRSEYGKSEFSENKVTIYNRVIELEGQTINTKSVRDFNYMKANENELAYWSKASEREKKQLITENDSIKLLEIKNSLIESVENISADSIKADSIRTNALQMDSTKIQTTIPVIEPPKTGKIIFKVQIGAYNTELPESAKKLYKKISALRKIDQTVDERNYTVYTIGELNDIKDAVKLQEQIRQESVKDAFIVAYKDGKRIPLNEALESKK